MIGKLTEHGWHPVIFDGEMRRPFLGDMLALTRKIAAEAGDDGFGWINSDCVPDGLFFNAQPTGVIGFHRRESADGTKCMGVDGYIFEAAAWDRYYAPDIPQMYVGATHVDWWITRLAQKHGIYSALTALRHESHTRTAASQGADYYGQHNLRAFHAWAQRNGVSIAYE